MATLANQTISSTYDGLIKTSTDQPVPISGVQLLEDGVGNSLALSVGRANQGVTITGTLSATSISGVLADGVTATTQTLGDNSTKVATTAYVDAQVTASDLDFAGDSGTGAVDLDSQTLTIAGTANEIETSASGQTITIGLPSSVTVGTLNATTLAGTLSTAAQTNITSVGTLSSLAVSGATTLSGGVSGNTAFSGNLTIGSVSVGKNINTFSSAYGSNGVHSFYGTDNNLKLQIGGLSNNLSFLYSPSGVGMTFYTGASERMRIDSSGNVGIGTSSPTQKLDVSNSSGEAYIRVDSAVNQDGGFRISEAGTNKWLIYNVASSDALAIYDNTATSERLRINSSGNVGIGTSSPSAKLSVSGSISATDDINTTSAIKYSSGVKFTVANKRQIIRIAGNNGGANIFQSQFSSPQVGFLYVYELNTSNYLVATVFKQSGATIPVYNIISNNVLTIGAMNTGGTMVINNATDGNNVRMKAVIEEC